MDRIKPALAKWLMPVTFVLAIAAVYILGVDSDVVVPAVTSVVNALLVSNYFRARLAGTTAFYILAQVEPDDDRGKYVDWVMIGAAAFSLLAPICLIVEGRI